MLKIEQLEMVATMAYKDHCMLGDQVYQPDQTFLRSSFFRVTSLPVLEE